MNQNDIMAAIKFFESYKMHCGNPDFIDMAISALEKQVAKKPEHKVHEKYKALGKNHYCSCGVMFVDWENQPTNYCGNCGQKLKEA